MGDDDKTLVLIVLLHFTLYSCVKCFVTLNILMCNSYGLFDFLALYFLHWSWFHICFRVDSHFRVLNSFLSLCFVHSNVFFSEFRARCLALSMFVFWLILLRASRRLISLQLFLSFNWCLPSFSGLHFAQSANFTRYYLYSCVNCFVTLHLMKPSVHGESLW